MELPNHCQSCALGWRQSHIQIMRNQAINTRVWISPKSVLYPPQWFYPYSENDKGQIQRKRRAERTQLVNWFMIYSFSKWSIVVSGQEGTQGCSGSWPFRKISVLPHLRVTQSHIPSHVPGHLNKMAAHYHILTHICCLVQSCSSSSEMKECEVPSAAEGEQQNKNTQPQSGR